MTSDTRPFTILKAMNSLFYLISLCFPLFTPPLRSVVFPDSHPAVTGENVKNFVVMLIELHLHKGHVN